MTIEYFPERNPGTHLLPRSVATRAGGFVFVGGQVARDVDGSIIVGGDEYGRHTATIAGQLLLQVDPGELGLGSLDASYHFFPKKVRGNAAPYVSGGYTLFFGHNTIINGGKDLTTNGFNVGGGVDYYATKHVGVRLDVRYYGHGGRILHYTFPDVDQFTFVAARVALTFR